MSTLPIDVADPGHDGDDTNPGRVLVFDDRAEAGHLVQLLGRAGGFAVTRVGHLDDGLRALSQPWDLLLVDPVLAAGRGRSFVHHARSVAPGLAVGALVGPDDPALPADLEVTRLPLGASDLQALVAVARLVEGVHHARHGATETVLAIGAHPDDVEIGVGGTLLAHRGVGHAVNVLTLSQGARGGDTRLRVDEAQAAAEILGARLFLEDLDDTQIPAGHPTVQVIEAVIAAVAPTIIYTHSINDNHQDHRAVHQASMVAARGVGKVLAYQAPSATVDFRPTRFVPMEAQLEDKQRAIAVYASQTSRAPYLQPDVISATSRYWARFSGAQHAEAFEVVRDASGLARTTEPGGAPGRTKEHAHAGR